MKRTLEGTKIKRQRVSGFRARMATSNGQEVLNRRRAKGRHQPFPRRHLLRTYLYIAQGRSHPAGFPRVGCRSDCPEIGRPAFHDRSRLQPDQFRQFRRAQSRLRLFGAGFQKQHVALIQ